MAESQHAVEEKSSSTGDDKGVDSWHATEDDKVQPCN